MACNFVVINVVGHSIFYSIAFDVTTATWTSVVLGSMQWRLPPNPVCQGSEAVSCEVWNMRRSNWRWAAMRMS